MFMFSPLSGGSSGQSTFTLETNKNIINERVIAKNFKYLLTIIYDLLLPIK